MPDEWTTTRVPCGQDKSFQWGIQEQGLLDGGLEISCVVTIATEHMTASRVWDRVVLPAGWEGYRYVRAAVVQARAASVNGDHQAVTDIFALLRTL